MKRRDKLSVTYALIVAAFCCTVVGVLLRIRTLEFYIIPWICLMSGIVLYPTRRD